MKPPTNWDHSFPVYLMKICSAQTKALKGNIESNINNHKRWIELAAVEKTDLIVFPELSLTGYEPKIAKTLAMDPNDSRLDEFQRISDWYNIIIGIGLPTKSEGRIYISLIFFQPKLPRLTYSKQLLHPDEKPYFTNGKSQFILTLGSKKAAPAICFESLQPEHAKNAHALGANIYIASVAKSKRGIDRAIEYFPKLAKKYAMPVFMANCIGISDNFECKGQTSAWDKNGTLVGQLSKNSEGILIYETETGELIKKEKIL